MGRKLLEKNRNFSYIRKIGTSWSLTDNAVKKRLPPILISLPLGFCHFLRKICFIPRIEHSLDLAVYDVGMKIFNSYFLPSLSFQKKNFHPSLRKGSERCGSLEGVAPQASGR